MEAKFIFSKEILKTVNEFAFCLLIGQIGSSFFLCVEELFRVSIVFSCFLKNASNCIVASQKNESKSNNETNFVWAKKERDCLLYTSPSPRDTPQSRMPSSA